MMESESISPESIVKFFIGLSSAGIGLIAASASQLKELPTYVYPEVITVLVSVVCFSLSIFEAGAFYHGATGIHQREPRMISYVRRCSGFSLMGVLFLAVAAIVGVGSWLGASWGPRGVVTAGRVFLVDVVAVAAFSVILVLIRKAVVILWRGA